MVVVAVAAVVNVGITVLPRVMVHFLATASSVAVLAIGLVTALILVVVDLGVSLPSSVVLVAAGETAFLDQTGLVIVMEMIAMIVAVMDTVTPLTAETGMTVAVTVTPATGTPLEVTALVRRGTVLQIAISQVQQDMAGSGREAMRETRCVAALPMTGVAQGAVQAMTGMARGAALVVAMTGMVRVEEALTMAAEGLLAMMEGVTGRGLGRMTAPAGEEDATRTASSDSVIRASSDPVIRYNEVMYLHLNVISLAWLNA